MMIWDEPGSDQDECGTIGHGYDIKRPFWDKPKVNREPGLILSTIGTALVVGICLFFIVKDGTCRGCGWFWRRLLIE